MTRRQTISDTLHHRTLTPFTFERSVLTRGGCRRVSFIVIVETSVGELQMLVGERAKVAAAGAGGVHP